VVKCLDGLGLHELSSKLACVRPCIVLMEKPPILDLFWPFGFEMPQECTQDLTVVLLS